MELSHKMLVTKWNKWAHSFLVFGGVTNIFNHQVKQGTRKNGFRVLVLVLLNNNYNNPLQDGPCPDLNSRDTLEALWKTLISIGIGLKEMYNVLTPKSI